MRSSIVFLAASLALVSALPQDKRATSSSSVVATVTSTYVNNTQYFSRVDCYNDPADFTLYSAFYLDISLQAGGSTGLTVEKCTNGCASNVIGGYLYAALVDASSCLCFNTDVTAIPGFLTKSTLCDDPCPGDLTEICGGIPTGSNTPTTKTKGQFILYKRTPNLVYTGTTTKVTSTSSSTQLVSSTSTKASTSVVISMSFSSTVVFSSSKATSSLTASSTTSFPVVITPTSSTSSSKVTTSAASSASYGTFTPIGCYADQVTVSAVRVLPNKIIFGDSSLTIEKCLNACSSYALAGVEYGQECWCANNFVVNQTSTSCNYPCTGNNAQNCGGFDAISVYRNTVVPLGDAVPLSTSSLMSSTSVLSTFILSTFVSTSSSKTSSSSLVVSSSTSTNLLVLTAPVLIPTTPVVIPTSFPLSTSVPLSTSSVPLSTPSVPLSTSSVNLSTLVSVPQSTLLATSVASVSSVASSSLASKISALSSADSVFSSAAQSAIQAVGSVSSAATSALSATNTLPSALAAASCSFPSSIYKEWCGMGSVIPSQLASALTGASVSTNVFLPLYIYPSWWITVPAWAWVRNIAGANPGTTFTVVINPSNGPTTDPNSDYVQEIKTLQRYSNIRVLGYVNTKYGNRDTGSGTNSVDSVGGDIETYANWGAKDSVSLDGVFLDAQASSADYLALYKSYYYLAKQQFPNGIVGSGPGMACDPGYLSTFDFVVVYQGAVSGIQGALANGGAYFNLLSNVTSTDLLKKTVWMMSMGTPYSTVGSIAVKNLQAAIRPSMMYISDFNRPVMNALMNPIAGDFLSTAVTGLQKLSLSLS